MREVLDKVDAKFILFLVVALVAASVAMASWWLGVPADPPGYIENTKLTEIFNQEFDVAIQTMDPSKSSGYSPKAKESARKYLADLKTVIQYRKYKHKQHPSLPNGMRFSFAFKNGLFIAPESDHRVGSVSATGVRLEFEGGKVVSSKTDGSELELSQKSARTRVAEIVKKVFQQAENMESEAFFNTPSAPTVEDNKKAWGE